MKGLGVGEVAVTVEIVEEERVFGENAEGHVERAVAARLAVSYGKRDGWSTGRSSVSFAAIEDQ